MAAPILDVIYAQRTIEVFPEGTTPAHLTHTYEAVRNDHRGPIDFNGVTQRLTALRGDVDRWYHGQTGDDMNTFKLGDMLDPVRQRFWRDSRFREAFDILGLDYDADHEKATIPWWNEIAAGERSNERVEAREATLVHVTMQPRHSLETQLMRAGIERPVRNISGGGVILTAPERGASDGYLVIGLRGGASFANTYHVNAGAIKSTPSLRNGTGILYDTFRQHELEAEFGIQPEDVVDARLLSRVDDSVIDQGPMYNFAVRTNLDKEALTARWKGNLDPDKQEHDQPVFLKATPEEVWAFVQQRYRGVVANKDGRGDEERFLLHPGALVLASFAGKQPIDLRALYQEGVH